MKKDDSKQKQRVKNYLLPSIRLPGRGLPLNMAAVHPRMDFNRHKRERRGKVLLQFTTRKSRKWKKSCSIDERKPPPPHYIHRTPHQTDGNTDMITITDRKERLSVTPLSLALSLSSTSTSLYSFSASRRMLPSLWKRKRRGKVMSSVLRPSPAIWNSGAVSLLLPSLSSGRDSSSEITNHFTD